MKKKVFPVETEIFIEENGRVTFADFFPEIREISRKINPEKKTCWKLLRNNKGEENPPLSPNPLLLPFSKGGEKIPLFPPLIKGDFQGGNKMRGER